MLSGYDRRAPQSGCHGAESAAPSLDHDLRGLRLAWSRDLGGLPVESAVSEVLEAGRPVLAELGCAVREAEPDFDGAEEAFTTWRAWLFDLSLGRHYDGERDQLGEDVRWNIERGRTLTGPQLAAAERARTALYHRMRGFFADHYLLVAPVVQVLPFPVDRPYPAAVAGEPITTYIDWMKSCWYVSAASLPAVSVPFGFTQLGLPVGLQVIGPHNGDWAVLQLAHAIERETGHWRRRPAAGAD